MDHKRKHENQLCIEVAVVVCVTAEKWTIKHAVI